MSDLLALRRNEVFNNDGTIAKNAYIRDKKTGKPNILYLKPVKQDLLDYFQWLNQENLHKELYHGYYDTFRQHERRSG